MNLRIYLIIEEGADRVYVCGTAYPAWYVKPKDRRAEIVAVDVPLPDVEVDRVVKLGPELVSTVESVNLPGFFCVCGVYPGQPAMPIIPSEWWRHTSRCPHGSHRLARIARGCPDGCGASEKAHCWNNSDWAEDGG